MNLKEYIIKRYKQEIMESIAVELEQTIDNIKDEMLIFEDEIDDLHKKIDELKKDNDILKMYIVDLQNQNIAGK